MSALVSVARPGERQTRQVSTQLRETLHPAGDAAPETNYKMVLRQPLKQGTDGKKGQLTEGNAPMGVCGS